MNSPPQNLPRYRLLTGPDDDDFCWRVSEALDLGYRLHGSPGVSRSDGEVVVCQALIWPESQNEGDE